MITLSLCMIVKNESQTLARCLDSARDIADELIIVDTGSADSTVDIALKYTKDVYNFQWTDDFSAARNFAFSKATQPYIMWLDADDMILPADRTAILQLKRTLPESVDTVMLRYHTSFDESGAPTFSYFRERIMRNCPLARWNGAVHEVVTPFGNIHYSEAAICHKKMREGDPARNLKIYRKMLDSGHTLDARERFYYARELYYNGLYAEAQRELDDFLRSGKGWIENNIEACRFLAFCLYAQNEPDSALRALFRALEYAAPRAELCCDIGNHMLERGNYASAAHWFECALSCARSDASGAFVEPECYGYLPCIQLCVCYYHLGDIEKSMYFNRRAGEYKPKDAAFLKNLEFFDKLQQNESR